MNFIKKTIMLSLAFTLFSMNVEGMKKHKQTGKQSDRTNDGLGDQKKPLTSYLPSRDTILNLGDYLAQLGSIYSIDSTSANTVDGLAKLRALFNVVPVLRAVGLCWDNGSQLLDAHIFNIGAIIDACVRGNNIHLDYKNWNDSASIASSNAGRKQDKSLDDKKLCQYAWLTINKLLPLIMGKLRNQNCVINYQFLASFSELYRQKLMYAMISNKQRA